MERREAPALSKRERGKTERLVRRLALHPLALREERKPVPAKAGKTTAHPAPLK